MTRHKIAVFHEEALFLDPEYFDEAIIGIAERADGMRVVAYDRMRCIELIAAHNGMGYEDAAEYFEFNTAGSFVGEMTPVFVDTRFAE